MKQRWIVALVAGVLGPSDAPAEVAFALGPWHYSLAGTITQEGSTLDFQDDLALESGNRRMFRLEWNASRGWWPELAVDHSSVETRGQQLQVGGAQFGPVPISDGDTLLTRGNLDDSALLARYPFAWGPLRLDAGVTIRRLSGEIVITNMDSGDEDRQPYDELFPEVSGGLRWPLGRVLTLVGSARWVRYQGNAARQWRAGVEINVFDPMTIEYSLLHKQYDLSAGSYALDASVEGNLLQIGVRMPR